MIFRTSERDNAFSAVCGGGPTLKKFFYQVAPGGNVGPTRVTGIIVSSHGARRRVTSDLDETERADRVILWQLRGL